jgi:hypothetical protein
MMFQRFRRLLWPAVVVAGLGHAPAVQASDLECYEEPGTMANTCISTSAVRQNGDLRSSPLFSGGPREVRRTSFTIVTDCARGVSTLQDRQGKNFGGGASNSTKAIRSLSEWICAVPKPKRDGSIRQF